MSNKRDRSTGNVRGRYESRLRHQLEVQSQQIERVLSEHQFSAQIAGGRVQQRTIHFDLTGYLGQGWERLRTLTYELKRVLNVPDVRLSREGGQLRLHVARPEQPPVALLDLLPLLPDLPPTTATLGLDEDGRPVLLDFANPGVTHVLLAGGQGAGKSTLLRTVALSLALKNRQSQLQLLVIDPDDPAAESKNTFMEPLAYLPHMLTGITHRVEESLELLNFVRGEMEYRVQQQQQSPTIVLLVDKADYLLDMGGEPIVDALTALLLNGADVGIHLVLSMRQPEIAVGNNQLRANLTVRLVGQVEDEAMAATATGLLGTQAEYLLKQGDFLAVVGGAMTHFQAAYIGDYDLHLCLEDLYRNRPRPLLAYPVAMRPTIPPENDDGAMMQESDLPQSFHYDGYEVELEIEDQFGD